MRSLLRALLPAVVLLAACGNGEKPTKAEPPANPAPTKPGAKPDAPVPEEKGAPEHVVYDQILIAFKGSYDRADIDRPQETAKELAERVLDLAQSGGDFDALKEEYTDDRDKEGRPLGLIYAARDDVQRESYEIYRKTLFQAPRELIFKLKVGAIGYVAYDPRLCPDGFLIIKRVK
jgi:hypothetical protein